MLDIDAARDRLAQGRKHGGTDVPMMDYLDVSLIELTQARAAVVKLAGVLRDIERRTPAVAAIVGGGG